MRLWKFTKLIIFLASCNNSNPTCFAWHSSSRSCCFMHHHHTQSGYKRLSGSEDIFQTKPGHTDRQEDRRPRWFKCTLILFRRYKKKKRPARFEVDSPTHNQWQTVLPFNGSFHATVFTGIKNDKKTTAYVTLQSQFSLALKTTKHGIYHFAKSVSTGIENDKTLHSAKLKITCCNQKQFTLHCSVGISTGQHPTADPSWVQGTQVRLW